MSFASVFAYEVDPQERAAFEAVYGPDGEWARLFRGADGNEDARQLYRAEQVLGRFESL